MTCRAHFGEAVAVYPRLESGYALIVSDGAYGIGGFPGDPTSPRHLADWYAPHLEAWDRLAAPSSSLYLWSTPEGCARLLPAVEAAGWTRNSRIVWSKPAGRTDADTIRGWPEHRSEECHVYTRETVDIGALAVAGLVDDGLAHRSLFEAAGADERNTVRAFLRAEWARAGLTRADAETAWCSTVSHYFGRSQWEMPTWEAYRALAEHASERGVVAADERPVLVTEAAWTARNGADPLRVSYGALRVSYEALRAEYEALRYPFALPRGASDVWIGAPVVGPRRHPCAKRQEHVDRIVLTSSRPGDRVLEPFGGGAPVLRACRRLGRSCDSIERDPEWHAVARAVLGEHAAVDEPDALPGQGRLW